ncbi:MAG: hypothetical protein JXR96_22560 [Deltaproteobacteria bacterium]|nr:hypothetical protein [Deltaproteobacteria bacterium]
MSRLFGFRRACHWALLVAIAVSTVGCPAKPPRTKKAGPPEIILPVHAERRFEARVDEKDRLLAGEKAARDYLRQKLIGLMANQLVKLGYDPGRAGQIATLGKLEAFSVRGHREKVKTEGGVAEREIWDVRGHLIVDLRDAEVTELGARLESLPRESLDEVRALTAFLPHFGKLEPDRVVLARLRSQAGDRWAELLGPYLKAETDRPVQPLAAYLDGLRGVAATLSEFHGHFPDHPAHERLEKDFVLAALKALQTIEVKADNQAAIEKLLGELDEMAGRFFPRLLPFLKRKLELAWRDRLVQQDEDKLPFEKIRDDFVIFMRQYERSEFYPDLQLRFLKRWSESMRTRRIAGLDDLAALQQEVRLMGERFAEFEGLAEVRQLLGERCVQVLAKVEMPDLEALERIDKIVAGCDPFMASGSKTLAARERLARRRADLERERDARLEKAALRDLAFFQEWDRAVRDLPWGKPREGWEGKGAFVGLWGKGKDAGESCRCSLDPDEPCRVFDAEGASGGFEVVARFHGDRLMGLDLCEVYTGGILPTVYRFYSRRYARKHSKKQAAAFLSGARGGVQRVGFASKGGLNVVLERSVDSCTVRYRDAGLEAELQRQERQARDEMDELRAQERLDRIERGWQPGDCVRWDCHPACRYTGRVRAMRAGRYELVVTEVDDPREQGKVLWVRGEQLYDCE